MGAKGAAAAAALAYVALSGRLSSSPPDGGDAAATVDAVRRRRGRTEGERKEEEERERWPERAPASWREPVAGAARTAGFAYAETLGKWPLGDIAFGINHYMRVQGNLQHEYAGSGCVPLEGPGVRQELIGLLRYLGDWRWCRSFVAWWRWGWTCARWWSATRGDGASLTRTRRRGRRKRSPPLPIRRTMRCREALGGPPGRCRRDGEAPHRQSPRQRWKNKLTSWAHVSVEERSKKRVGAGARARAVFFPLPATLDS